MNLNAPWTFQECGDPLDFSCLIYLDSMTNRKWFTTMELGLFPLECQSFVWTQGFQY